MKRLSKFEGIYFRSVGYKNLNFSKKFTMYWWSNRFFARLIKKYIKKGNLLELGCGMGDILLNLSDKENFNLTGVDISHYSIGKSKLKDRSGRIRFICSPMEKVSFDKKSFDLIFSKHMLEHLKSPENAIAKISSWLKPGGFFVMVTPNLDCLLKNLKGCSWHGYADKTHISLKTPKDWRFLLGMNDFKIRKQFSDGFWNVPYLPIIPNFLQKLFFGFPGGIQAVTGLVFIPIKMGESLILVAQKK